MRETELDNVKKRSRRKFVDVAYGQLHLRIASPKDVDVDVTRTNALVCLHQSPKSSREFSKFIEIAGGERLTIAPDYPGYGESDPPPANPPVRIEDYARSVWEALDALGVAKVDLFGNHTGDSVAVEMTYQQPTRVGRIAMISAPVLTDKERAEFDEYFQPVALDRQGSRFQNIWNRINQYRSPEFSLEMMATSFAETLRAGDDYEWGHRAAFTYNDTFIARIAELHHRILVLNPADLLYEISLRVKPLLKNGQLVNLPNWGAGILDIYPEDVYQIICSQLLNRPPD